MDKHEAETFEGYLDLVPESRREGTRSIIAAMREILPATQENLRWGIAIFSHDGDDIVGISARKNYYSLYVPDPDVLEQFARELGKVNPGDGCIRFARLKDIKMPVLRRMIKELGRRAFSI